MIVLLQNAINFLLLLALLFLCLLLNSFTQMFGDFPLCYQIMVFVTICFLLMILHDFCGSIFYTQRMKFQRSSPSKAFNWSLILWLQLPFSCYIETLLECYKHLQLECNIRVATTIFSCNLGTLLVCCKDLQLECCIGPATTLFS